MSSDTLHPTSPSGNDAIISSAASELADKLWALFLSDKTKYSISAIKRQSVLAVFGSDEKSPDTVIDLVVPYLNKFSKAAHRSALQQRLFVCLNEMHIAHICQRPRVAGKPAADADDADISLFAFAGFKDEEFAVASV